MGVSKTQKRRRMDYSRGLLKIVVLFILLAICLIGVTVLFRWSTVDQIPEFLRSYASLLLAVGPYLRYIDAAIILVLGYLIVGEVGRMVYAYMRGFADHSAAATLQNIMRIVGFGVLLAVLASVFSVDPATALTLGGFGGLVVGFATQAFLSNTIAGIFVLLTRPFTFGDVVTMAGNTGVVKEIRLMHIHLESLDGSKDIMIPNSLVLSQVILKNRPGERMGPIPTTITLDQPPEAVKIGAPMVFTGHLTESASGKPLAGAGVRILDRDIGRDDLLSEGLTDADGNYRISWLSRKVDPFDDTADIYAKFEGDEEHRSSYSKKFVVVVK